MASPVRYLIDGHNLIGACTSIKLGEEHDEIRLITLLKGFVKRQHTCLVVFDRGLPGGYDPALSTSRVRVVFASGRMEADELLIREIRNLRDKAGTQVVSSDRRIQEAARHYGVKAVKSQVFQHQICQPADAQPGTTPEVDEKPAGLGAERDAYYTMFGIAPDEEP
jgi:predicted RNA-binding protein with PIN domain